MMLSLFTPSQVITARTRSFIPSGKGLEWMGCIGDDVSTYYGQSLKICTSVSRDISKSHFSLQLSSVIAEDRAMYY
jgi:hypothetical protein